MDNQCFYFPMAIFQENIDLNAVNCWNSLTAQPYPTPQLYNTRPIPDILPCLEGRSNMTAGRHHHQQQDSGGQRQYPRGGANRQEGISGRYNNSGGGRYRNEFKNSKFGYRNPAAAAQNRNSYNNSNGYQKFPGKKNPGPPRVGSCKYGGGRIREDKNLYVPEMSVSSVVKNNQDVDQQALEMGTRGVVHAKPNRGAVHIGGLLTLPPVSAGTPAVARDTPFGQTIAQGCSDINRLITEYNIKSLGTDLISFTRNVQRSASNFSNSIHIETVMRELMLSFLHISSSWIALTSVLEVPEDVLGHLESLSGLHMEFSRWQEVSKEMLDQIQLVLPKVPEEYGKYLFRSSPPSSPSAEVSEKDFNNDDVPPMSFIQQKNLQLPIKDHQEFTKLVVKDIVKYDVHELIKDMIENEILRDDYEDNFEDNKVEGGSCFKVIQVVEEASQDISNSSSPASSVSSEKSDFCITSSDESLNDASSLDSVGGGHPLGGGDFIMKKMIEPPKQPKEAVVVDLISRNEPCFLFGGAGGFMDQIFLQQICNYATDDEEELPNGKQKVAKKSCIEDSREAIRTINLKILLRKKRNYRDFSKSQILSKGATPDDVAGKSIGFYGDKIYFNHPMDTDIKAKLLDIIRFIEDVDMNYLIENGTPGEVQKVKQAVLHPLSIIRYWIESDLYKELQLVLKDIQEAFCKARQENKVDFSILMATNQIEVMFVNCIFKELDLF